MFVETWSHFQNLELARKMVISASLPLMIAAAAFSILLISHNLPEGQITDKLPSTRPAYSLAPSERVSGLPAHLLIPSVNINVSVIKGYETNGKWTLTIDSAQFATMTSTANNYQGDTFIYAHYRAGLFKDLRLIKPGALAYVTTANGYKFTYKFDMTYALKPDNTSIFSYHGAPILTLQTCSGAQFQNRQMFQFTYLDYRKV